MQWQPDEVPANETPASAIELPKSITYTCSFLTSFVFTWKVVVPPVSTFPALVIWSPEHCPPVQVAETTDAVAEVTAVHTGGATGGGEGGCGEGSGGGERVYFR